MVVPSRAEDIESLFDGLDARAYAATTNPAHIAELHADELTAIAAMAPNRQAEFATARACARAALTDLGVCGPVPRLEGGAPGWPFGVRGSISHTRGFCVGVASLAPASIGLDVEEIARMKPAVERRILVDHERDWLEPLDLDDRRRMVTIVFAAKEAFYKAHHAIEARYLGFDAVAVSHGGDGTLTFSPASDAVDPARLRRTIGTTLVQGGRAIVGVRISTGASAVPLPSPA